MFVDARTEQGTVRTVGLGSTLEMTNGTAVGLKLIPDRAPVEILVIDHIERPTSD